MSILQPHSNETCYFDMHCHISHMENSEEVIHHAITHGVELFLCCGSCTADIGLVRQLGENMSTHVAVAFGVHPWYVDSESEHYLDQLRDALKNVPHASVGEIGLDKTVGKKKGSLNWKRQISVFQDQMKLASDLNRPVSVHCVKGFGKLMELLTQAKAEGWLPPKVLLHGFSGSKEMVSTITSAFSNVYFSFGPTFSSVRNGKQLREVPLDRLLIETDAPSRLRLADGEENVPSNLPNVFERIQKCLQTDEALLKRVLYENSVSFVSVNTKPGKVESV